MKIRLSLQSRIFVGLGTLAIALLSVVWIVVRPNYENSVIAERITIVQQLQNYAIENLDKQIAVWASATHAVVWQITERPREGEFLLRNTMAMFPEIIQIRIYSPGLPDELTSQNVAYPVPAVQAADSQFVPSNDSLVSVAWLTHTVGNPSDVFITRSHFLMMERQFFVSIVWNANLLQRSITRLPLGVDYFLGIYSPSVTIFENRSDIKIQDTIHSHRQVNNLRTIRLGESDWRVMTGALQSAQWDMVVAVPERAIVEPVHKLLLYSSTCIVGMLILLLIGGWLLSYQISRPISLLVRDVERLGNLDFQQTIRIPVMHDLRKMGETVESMRQALERYQHLNVEKIIVEEWKNKLFMNHSDDLIAFTDGEGKFVFRNEKFDELCETLSPSQALTSSADVFQHPKVFKLKETRHIEAADMLTIRLIQSELHVQPQPEIVHYYRVNDLSILRGNENMGSLVIFHDLTNDRLIDKMKTDMMNVVVHELRNPVGSIMGFSDILLNDDTVQESERHEFLQHIMTSSHNLNALINRFLDISRLESRHVEYQKKLSDAAVIVRDVAKSLQPQLAKKSLLLDVFIEENIPHCVLVPDLFREAVLNLLSNAIKYGGAQRTIELTLTRDDKELLFSITDHGYGIPPEAREKLFSKFYRIAGNKRAMQEVGTGLGLAYVKEIAGYHNGSITLDSNDTIGCRFVLRIPIVMEATV